MCRELSYDELRVGYSELCEKEKKGTVRLVSLQRASSQAFRGI